MKLTKKEAEKICKMYNLGELNSIELMKKGLANYNFKIKCSKGKFVIRVLGKKLKKWEEGKLKEEFMVLEFLNNNDFEYNVPKPLRNSFNRKVSKINSKTFWVYRFIEGEISQDSKNVENSYLKELAKAIALYHKKIAKLKVNFQGEEGFRNWIYEGLKKMESSQRKTKEDKLAKENIELLKKIVKIMEKKDFKKNPLMNHRDFNFGNVLFKKGSIVGIIDFGNVEVRPRINDIATSIEYNCFTNNEFDKKKMNLFLRTYEKYNKLTKEEKEIIPYYMIQETCAAFRWIYDGMNKQRNKRLEFMQDNLNNMKQIIKTFNLKI